MSEGILLGDAVVKIQTGKAALVAFSDFADDIEIDAIEDEDAFWIPNSCIHEDSECYGDAGTKGKLIVKSWWAARQGLIDDES